MSSLLMVGLMLFEVDSNQCRVSVSSFQNFHVFDLYDCLDMENIASLTTARVSLFKSSK